MKNGGNTLAWLAGGVVLCISAQILIAAAQANPYQGIVERNPFGLRIPPPPPQPAPPPPPPVPKIKLQGIHYLLGKWQVLFTAQVQGKPNEPAKEVGFVLNEGERVGDYEVKKIDGKAGSVIFINHDQQQTLTMDRDVAKPLTGAVPGITVAGAPPAPGVPAAPMPAPVPMPAIPNPAAAAGMTTTGSRMSSVPSRTLRQPYGGAAPLGSVSVPGGAPGGLTLSVGGSTPGVVTVSPTPGVIATPQYMQPQQPQLSPEEQIILIEANRQLTAQQVMAGELPPLPPTPLTPPDAPGAPGVSVGVGRGLAPQ